MAKTSENAQSNVAVVYHFLAHYRGPVFARLLSSCRHRYLLVADRVDPRDRKNEGGAEVKGWLPDDGMRFIDAKCSWLPGNLMWQKGLFRLALRRDLEAIVYLADPRYPATWLSALLARLTGKRVLFWTIGWFHREPWWQLLIKRLYYGIAHDLLLYGHFAKSIAIREHFTPTRVHVVYNSLDYEKQRSIREQVSPDRLREVRRELFGNSDCRMVVCVSRLQEKRRLDMLVEAAAILKREGRPVQLLLVGDGPEREALRSSATAAGVDAHFYGPCYDVGKLGELVMASHVTVAPGMVGLTAMQSLAYGTPVISHGDPWLQSPEFESIIPGWNGDLFKHGDVEDLAAKVRQWTTGDPTDPERRRRCYAMIDRFYNPEKQARIIERAVDGHPASDLYNAYEL